MSGIPAVTDSELVSADAVAFNEVQLLLAEKRTSLSVLRTGIAVLALPLSALSVLIATSRYYDVASVLHFLVPVVLLCVLLLIFGSYLIISSVHHMRHYDRLVSEVKQKHSLIARLME